MKRELTQQDVQCACHILVMLFGKMRVISAFVSQQNREEKEVVKFYDVVTVVNNQAGSVSLW